MYSIVEIFFFSLSVFPAFHFSCFSIIFSFSFAGGKSFIKVVYVTYYTEIFFFGGFINKKLHFHFLTLLYSLFPSFPIFFLFLYANNSTNFPFVMCRIWFHMIFHPFISFVVVVVVFVVIHIRVRRQWLIFPFVFFTQAPECLQLEGKSLMIPQFSCFSSLFIHLLLLSILSQQLLGIKIYFL